MYKVSLSVKSKQVQFNVDCGAAVTLVSWLKTYFPNLKIYQSNIKLRSYCEENFTPLGYVKVKINDMNIAKTLNMYIVK